jgi:hypothetical protein
VYGVREAWVLVVGELVVVELVVVELVVVELEGQLFAVATDLLEEQYIY